MNPSVEDHLAIINLLAQYCLTLDHDDVEGWVSLFTPDGSIEVYGKSFASHDGLRAMTKVAPGGLHLGGPPVVVQVDADHAKTQQNLLFVNREDGTSRNAVYDDDLVRTNDGWRIAKRRCRFIVPGGLSDRPAH
jgi:3-phenylpropionate/cinnamic acid dioxygenase small subunit